MIKYIKYLGSIPEKGTVFLIALLFIFPGISSGANPGEEAYKKAVEALISNNYPVALEEFQHAVDGGHHDSYFSLASMYYYGLGEQIDKSKAFDLAKKGHEAGSVPSSYLYARLLTMGIGELKPDEDRAKMIFKDSYIEWLQSHYESEMNPFYACALGVLYGGKYFDLKKEIGKVQFWYNKAIEQKFSLGYTGMGYLYDLGEGVDENNELAYNYYQKAADLDLPLGQYNLAIKLRYGEGVKKDLQRAITLLQKAGRKNFYSAFISLANIYDKDLGRDVDWFKAAEYYKIAAEHNFVTAKRELGQFYYFGIGGLDQNKTKAMELFKEAADEGDKIAKSYLQVLRDIENDKFYKLNQSEHGNSLFISRQEMLEEKEFYPYISDDQSLMWYTKINYSLGESDFVRIFPTTEIKDISDDSDYFWFQTYSASKAYMEINGTHEAGIGITDDENGYRDIAYIYFKGVFFKGVGERNFIQEVLYIKQPVAISVLPANYPGVKENIEAQKVDLEKEIIGKWRMLNSFIKCSDSSESLARDADDCEAKTTYEFFEDGTLNASIYLWDSDAFTDETECANVSNTYTWKIEDDVLIIKEKFGNTEFTHFEIKGNLLTLGIQSEQCESGGISAMDFRKIK